MTAIERLADVFVEVADTLVADFDLIDFLHSVAGHAAELTGGTTVGLVLADEQSHLHYMGASDESARLLELIQLQDSEGPCLDCFSTGRAVVNADLAGAAARWPSFAPQAVAAGFQSVHAFPMRLRDRVIGALNVFGREPIVLGDQEARIIQALADVATIALIQEQAIVGPRSSTSSCSRRSTAGWSSSRPRAPSPAPSGSARTTPSRSSAATPGGHECR